MESKSVIMLLKSRFMTAWCMHILFEIWDVEKTHLFYCLAIYSRCIVGGEMRPKRPKKTSKHHATQSDISRTAESCEQFWLARKSWKGCSNISGILIHEVKSHVCQHTMAQPFVAPHPPDESITKSVAVDILAVQQKKQMKQLDMMRTPQPSFWERFANWC